MLDDVPGANQVEIFIGGEIFDRPNPDAIGTESLIGKRCPRFRGVAAANIPTCPLCSLQKKAEATTDVQKLAGSKWGEPSKKSHMGGLARVAIKAERLVRRVHFVPDVVPGGCIFFRREIGEGSPAIEAAHIAIAVLDPDLATIAVAAPRATAARFD
jgi:hypothetical protein